MSYLKDYLGEMQDLQHFLLEYIDSEAEDEENYRNLINKYESSNISKKRGTIKDFLYLISNIANNHRNPYLIQRIEQLLIHLKNQIGENFTFIDLLLIFKKNKRIILFLLKEKLIIPNKSISQLMINMNYHQYFYPEFKEFYPEELRKKIEAEINEIDNFEEKRLIGENDNYICQLIRQDSVEEFVTFVNKKNYPISSIIPPSIFETNPFLLKNPPTLIQYTAFYGSIQIFKYLNFNQVNIKDTWLYLIHSQNAELIHYLEENCDNPHPNFFRESIKCFSSDITEYIKNIFDDKLPLSSFHTLYPSLKYHNYKYWPDILDAKYAPFLLIKYDYIDLVKQFIKSDKLEFKREMSPDLISQISIQKLFFLFMLFQIIFI